MASRIRSAGAAPGNANARPTMAILVALSFALLGALDAWTPDAQANTTTQGITFYEKGGNEWWVQVQIVGSLQFWAGPEVRDSGGDWQWMQHPSWATDPQFFATSYHVEPGHRVQFRLNWKGNYLLSCWFTHPAGVEQCDGSETFSVAFHPSGNGELVKMTLDTNHAVGGLWFNAMPTGWSLDMSHAADGSWSRIQHIPDGSVLQFNAQSTMRGDQNGEYVSSACYRWPSVALVTCPTYQSPVAYSPFTTTGNWKDMQVYTSPPNNSYVSKVEVRFDGGTFQAMTPAQEGVWAYSNAPDTGTHIAQFRAWDIRGNHGCNVEQGFWWPNTGTYGQVGSSRNVIFAEMTGDTGWVQTNAYSWTPLVAMEVSVNGGPFHSIPYQPWCDWGGSMNVPSGSQVVFRAFFADLAHQDSAPVTWPPGTPPPPFTPTFTMVKGNEWWIQANVYPTDQIASVDFHADGGNGFQAWYPLKLQSWGAWAASYHIPDKAMIQLRATSKSGAVGLSQCYRWIPPRGSDAVAFDCANPPPPPPPFSAAFSNVKGNDWWVEASVSANQPLAGVDALVNCAGSWHVLTHQSWGSWAASFNVPSGSKVLFRARSTGGETSYSGGYTWPTATPTSAC